MWGSILQLWFSVQRDDRANLLGYGMKNNEREVGKVATEIDDAGAEGFFFGF